ncbi:hypothetical protein NC652_027006 [Populus alba x Populus x berolinensis]|nr:hypothetical protein NC652_027006 [Populus alba x Populus x berolinensis]
MEHQWATGITTLISLHFIEKGGEICVGEDGASEGNQATLPGGDGYCNPLVLGDGNCWNWWQSSLQSTRPFYSIPSITTRFFSSQQHVVSQCIECQVSWLDK